MPDVPMESENLTETLISLGEIRIGAGGGTRTHTTFYGPGILSPVRLPFRHTGNPVSSLRRHKYSKVCDNRKQAIRGDGVAVARSINSGTEERFLPDFVRALRSATWTDGDRSADGSRPQRSCMT